MPKEKKKMRVRIRDQSPAKDPKGGKHKHGSAHSKNEPGGPVDPPGFPNHPAQ